MGIDLAFAFHYNKEVVFMRNTNTAANNTTLSVCVPLSQNDLLLRIFVTNPLVAMLPIGSLAVDGLRCSYRNPL